MVHTIKSCIICFGEEKMSFTSKKILNVKKKSENFWTWCKENPFKITLLLIVIIISLILKIHEINVGAGDEFAGSDAWSYNNNAIEVLNGKGSISTYFNPLETLYLIPVYFVFGQNIFIAKFIQVLLSLLIPLFLFYVTKKYFGETAGYIAALLALVHPFIIYYSAHLWSEFWIIFLLSLLLYLFVQEQNRESIRKDKLFFIGIIGGVGALAKIWFLPLALMAGLFALFFKSKKLLKLTLSSIVGLGLILAGIAVILIPWSIYATNTTGYFVFINTNSQTNLIIGNNPDGEIAYTSRPYYLDEYINSMTFKGENCGSVINASTGTQKEMIRKKCAGKYATNYIITHPGKFIVKMTKFTFNYWAFPNLEYFQRYVRSPNTLLVSLWILWGFALIGIFVSLQKFKDFLFLYLAILGIWFVHGLTFYLARYKAGLAPIVIILSASGIYSLGYLVFSKKSKI